MLFVDTASLFLLSLCSFKLCAFLALNKNSDNNKDLEKKQINNIKLIDKFSKFGFYLFLFLAILQIYIFFNGLKMINNQFMFQYNQIDQQYETQKTQILSKKSSFSDQDLVDSELDNLTKSLNNKRDKFLNELNKANSNVKFILLRGNVKVFFMSLLWSYGLFKLSSFSYIKDD